VFVEEAFYEQLFLDGRYLKARCADGIKRAKARGDHLGRPAKLTHHQAQEARARRNPAFRVVRTAGVRCRYIDPPMPGFCCIMSKASGTWNHLETIYQRVLAAGDGALALNTEVESLQTAIADHIRVSKETGLKFRPASLNASLNLVKGATVAAGTYGLGLPVVAALMARVGAAISVGPGTALTWGKPTGTPFQYVSSYHKEVF
jgi:Family of unknown function (DUF6236)